MPVGAEGAAQILADPLTLSQPGGRGGADYAHHFNVWNPQISRLSYGPALCNFDTTWIWSNHLLTWKNKFVEQN
jgi:hypothetical protein